MSENDQVPVAVEVIGNQKSTRVVIVVESPQAMSNKMVGEVLLNLSSNLRADKPKILSPQKKIIAP